VGQKVNPIGLRLALNKNWSSRWFAKKENFGDWLHEDLVIRNFVKKNYARAAAVSKVFIERGVNRVCVTIYSARPGAIVGQKGAELEKLKGKLAKFIAKGAELILEVVEIKTPDTSAALVAENIASQLEGRIGFRRAMKQAI